MCRERCCSKLGSFGKNEAAPGGLTSWVRFAKAAAHAWYRTRWVRLVISMGAAYAGFVEGVFFAKSVIGVFCLRPIVTAGEAPAASVRLDVFELIGDRLARDR